MTFFSFTAGLLKPYITIYQSQKPLIPFEDDCQELLKINLRDVKNYMKKKDMHVDLGTQQELKNGCCDCDIYTQKGFCHSQ